MSPVASKVLSTVNASYGTSLSADQLAARICDPESAENFDCSAFCFFSEVNEQLQYSFLQEMDIDVSTARVVARKFSQLAGYALPLAKAA